MPRVSREQTEKNRTAIEIKAAELFRSHGLNGISVSDLMGAAGLTHGGFYGHFASKDVLAATACERAFAQSVTRWRTKIARARAAAAATGTVPVSGFAAVAAGYLDGAHRDDPSDGCAMTALATDVARESADKPIHATYTAGVKQLLQQLIDALPLSSTETGGATAAAAALEPSAALQQSQTPDSAMHADAAAIADRDAGAGDTAEPAQPEFSVDDSRTLLAMQQLALLVGSMTLARATAGDPLSDALLAAARAYAAGNGAGGAAPAAAGSAAPNPATTQPATPVVAPASHIS